MHRLAHTSVDMNMVEKSSWQRHGGGDCNSWISYLLILNPVTSENLSISKIFLPLQSVM